MDGIIDPGSSDHFAPANLCVNDFIPHVGKLYFGDNRYVKTLGYAKLGFLNVIRTQNLTKLLISSSKLAKDNDFVSVFDDERALVYDKFLLAKNLDATVLTATLKQDGLYHIDSFKQFYNPLYNSEPLIKNLTLSIIQMFAIMISIILKNYVKVHPKHVINLL